MPGKPVSAFPPCGRRLRVGESAVLRDDAIYCSDCADMLELVPHSFERRFTLERGAVCGGANPWIE